MDPQSIVPLITSLDPSVFRIESQTTRDDKRSLLAVHAAVRSALYDYVYLELGSHLGGSLLPHILDPHCRLAFSVDKRPPVQPDERGVNFSYADNSTARMIGLLSAHAPADSIGKLRTYDLDASSLTISEITEYPDLVLIDAEHTNEAVFRDFISIFKLCGSSVVYAFHDANLIGSGLRNIETFLSYRGVEFDSYILPNTVYVIATADSRQVIRSVGNEMGLNKESYFLNARCQLILLHYEIVRQQRAAIQRASSNQSS
jgi:hypothetical protein